jgi:hypothetical protein
LARLVLVLLGFADFLRRGVAARLRGFERENFARRFRRARSAVSPRLKPAPRQRAVESVGIVADEADVVHR